MYLPVNAITQTLLTQSSYTASPHATMIVDNNAKKPISLSGDAGAEYSRALVSNGARVNNINVINTNPVHGRLYLSQKSIANNVNINDGMVQLISGAQLENTNLSNHSMLDMHNTVMPLIY